ncbi:helix-turn-helix domain-containing protein [Ekhidna sp.]|uniref:helix-turn-helix domain-containing protein n=1 Tax=Ekhidna sp. TaxID=2608089 RepID=UPI0032EE3757
MYTQNIGLKEKLAIVEDIILIDSDGKYGNHVLVPDNNAEIIIPISDEVCFQCIGSMRSLRLLKEQSYFMMPRRRGAEIPLMPKTQCLVIKVNPIYARKISNSKKEISNGVFELGFTVRQQKRLLGFSSIIDRYEASDLLESMLEGVDDLYEYNSTILDSIEHIKDTHGTVSVKEIYSELNVSKSKLEQHFNKEIGLTPKEFCKIEKINHFISIYQSNDLVSLTELTYQCGYYDQSHLIKDFKYFLDTSPSKYFKSLNC